jgi:biotin synthase
MHRLGYETGSGFMVGLPGQNLETLAEDLLLLKEIPCDMAGIGPFISNPKTPLAGEKNGDPELTRRCVAIARLLLPEANLPLTTALSVAANGGVAANGEPAAQAGLQNAPDTTDDPAKPHISGTGENPFSFGANVIMKKVTPDQYKEAYEIYPAEYQKTDVLHDRRELERLIRNFGRVPL